MMANPGHGPTNEDSNRGFGDGWGNVDRTNTAVRAMKGRQLPLRERRGEGGSDSLSPPPPPKSPARKDTTQPPSPSLGQEEGRPGADAGRGGGRTPWQRGRRRRPARGTGRRWPAGAAMGRGLGGGDLVPPKKITFVSKAREMCGRI